MSNPFPFDDTIRIPLETWDIDSGEPIDIAGAQLDIRSPDLAVATYLFPGDSGFLHPRLGKIYFLQHGDQAGLWTYWWTVTGSFKGAFKGTFTVAPH